MQKHLFQGVRRPDDETDRVVHRGGRFINNVFVPSGAVPPREVRVRATFGGGSGVGSSASVDNQGRTAWARLAGEGEQLRAKAGGKQGREREQLRVW